MSLCTPHQRSAVAGARMLSKLQEMRASEGIRRMFKPPEWEWSQFGDVGWWSRDGWGELLLGKEGLRLDDWRQQGRLTTIKSGPHRVVYRVDLPQGAIYVKHFLVPDWRATLRQWVRRGKGRNEGKSTQHLASIGVPTITPVALGERRQRKFLFENYLVTLAISSAMPLDEFVERHLPERPEPDRSQIRHKLAEAMAVMTARLHEAGLLHHDFHPGNIMVRLAADNTPELFMIDLDALRKSRRVTWKLARQNLALLDHFFWLRSSRTDRYRFLKTYLRNRSERPPRVRGFARRIEESTRQWAERLWRRWGRRCRSSNKYFETHVGATTWCVASRDLCRSEIEPLLDDPDLPFRQPTTTLLKTSRTTTVAETTMVVQGSPSQVIYKRFNRKKWLDPLLTLFRPSRAWRSWQAGQHLASRGVPTPQNLAFISRRRSFKTAPLFWFLPHETYLITIKEQNVVDLGTYTRKVLPGLPPDERRARIKSLTVSLAELIRSLHDRSLSHRDLKAANILVSGDMINGRHALSVIDLVGVNLRHPIPLNRRVQNLARLCLSLDSVPGRNRADFLRFLRLYLPWGLSPLNDWKGFWRLIEKSMRSKRSRNQRRQRPLS
jgi:tRNA A-37 threonylcarbamoyl transferase component Bud32